MKLKSSLLTGERLFARRPGSLKCAFFGCCRDQALFESRPDFMFHLLCKGRTCSLGVRCGLRQELLFPSHDCLDSPSFLLFLPPPRGFKTTARSTLCRTPLVTGAAPLSIPCGLLLASAWRLNVFPLARSIFGPATASRGCIKSPKFTIGHRDT